MSLEGQWLDASKALAASSNGQAPTQQIWILENMPPFDERISNQAHEAARLKIIECARNKDDKLDLSGFSLKKIPPEIGLLKELSVLDARGNELAELPSEIGDLSNLEQILIDRNQIETFPKEIEKLKKLIIISASSNNMHEIPEEIGNLQSLFLLDARKNKINNLPLLASGASRIINLKLDDNLIEAVPPEIARFARIQELHLARNRINFLSPEIGQLKHLKILVISNNNIRELPEELGELASLEQINISNNFIEKIPESIVNLAKLKRIELENNLVSALPYGMSKLTALQRLDARRNKITTLPDDLADVDTLRRAAEADYSPYTEGLYLNENPLPDQYLRAITQKQPLSTRNLFGLLRGTVDPDTLPPLNSNNTSSTIRHTLPNVPRQTYGPHFEIDERNVITFAPPESIDADGNNIVRLRKLHPTIKTLAAELVAALGKGNIPHHALRDRADAYRALIDQQLDNIDFSLLFQAGIRLANAERAAHTDDELPPLTSVAREAVDSLIQLHSTFILSTREGQESIALEERYRRNPREEIIYREEAIALAEDLIARSDIIDPAVAEYIKGAAEEINRGSNLERSGVSATGAIKNITITLGTAAAVSGVSLAAIATGSPILIAPAAALVLVASEGLKKSKPFTAIAAMITQGLDHVSELDASEALKPVAERLRPQRDFFLSIEPRLRRLADRRGELRWLSELLDWLHRQKP